MKGVTLLLMLTLAVASAYAEQNTKTKEKKSGTFQIPVDSSNEIPGGGRMVIATSHRDDSSPSPTNQRQHDAVHQTCRFRSPDPYPYCHARVAASRCLWVNDGNRPSVSDIPDLSLPTPFYGKPAIGNAV